MKRAIKAGLVALSGATLLIAFAIPGWGQSRGGARRSGGMSRAPMARFVPRVANPFSPSYVRFNGVRSPGFVSSRQATIRITRDRFGRLHRVSIITPIFFGAGYPGYYPYDYEPYDDYGYYDIADDTAQQPAPWQSGPAPGESAVAAPEASVPDIGQFMLVRKDGQVVQRRSHRM